MEEGRKRGRKEGREGGREEGRKGGSFAILNEMHPFEK